MAEATEVTLDASPTPRSNSTVAAFERGAIVGRYVILDRLGAGAMGVVMAAYDPELDRKVALKLLEPRDEDRGAARARLQREAQALAKLTHRNVVAVHDVGVHEGQLFLAMEFVAGQTLRTWLRAGPRPWRDVVRVFLAAGRGLAAAHAAGLVHRDFKPDNVMLDDDRRVRVMDFGLARAPGAELGPAAPLDRAQLSAAPGVSSMLTQTGALLGTPAYMAPEQFRGAAADTRSDQFSFCIALYEALYGERPFAGTSTMELLDSMIHGAVSPAPRGTKVPSWLRKVVIRGLALAPEQRYPSLQALLDALGKNPTLRRRNGLAVAGVLGVLAFAAWRLSNVTPPEDQTCADMDEKLVGVWDDQRRAEVEAAIRATQRSFGPETWARVEQGLDEYTQRWLSARIEACEATRRGEQSGALLDRRMTCYDARLLSLRKLVDELAQADATIVEKAAHAVAGLPTVDRCADRQALAAELPPPEDPAVAVRVAALDEQLAVAKIREELGKYEQGLAVADQVVAEATTLGYEPLAARAWLVRGSLQEKLGDYEGAVQTLERAYATALAQRMPEESASAATQLMWVVGYRLVRHDEGRRWAIDAEPLSRAAGSDEARAMFRYRLGTLASSAGKYDEARGLLEQARGDYEAALGPDHPRLATVLIGLGNVSFHEGRYDEARVAYERAGVVVEAALGPRHPDLALSYNNLGNVALAVGDHERARMQFERSLAILGAAFAGDHPLLAPVLMSLGNVAFKDGELAEAREHYQRALAISEQAFGREHVNLAAQLVSLGNVARVEGKHAEARDHYEQALAIRERALGSEHPSLAFVHNNLGLVAHAQGHDDEAREHYERALAILQATHGPEHPDVADVINNLGALARVAGEWELARARHELAMNMLERGLGPEHPRVAEALASLGLLASARGEFGRARELHERALAILEHALGPDHAELVPVLTGLGEALLGDGKAAEAAEVLERALAIRSTIEGDPAELERIQAALARAYQVEPI
jgi:serine/threonine protein kinase/Tfp pilus assembly protein PilF